MECPKCGLLNPDIAQRCDCGYDFEDRTEHPAQGQPVAGDSGDLAQVEAVAVAYRQLIVWFAISQLTAVLGSVLMPAAGDDATAVGWLGLILSLCALSAAIVATVVMISWVYRLASSMGMSGAWAWSLGMLISCLNLVLLLTLSSRATSWRKRHGVVVGLLGPSSAEIARIRRQRHESAGPTP